MFVGHVFTSIQGILTLTSLIPLLTRKTLGNAQKAHGATDMGTDRPYSASEAEDAADSQRQRLECSKYNQPQYSCCGPDLNILLAETGRQHNTVENLEQGGMDVDPIPEGAQLQSNNSS